jgi:hypothetical protein
MSNDATSQTQQFMAFFPFAQFGFDAFRRSTEWQLAQVQTLCDEAQKLEGRAAEQARSVIDESARLMRETVGYAAQLSSEWRKLALEMARKGASDAAAPPR